MAEAPRSTDDIVTAFLAIERALSPVIGGLGVRSLYKRSLSIAAAGHPWVQALVAGALDDEGFGALRSALCERSPVEVHSAGTAVLSALQALLESMVGIQLTERLIGPALTAAQSLTPSQDPLP